MEPAPGMELAPGMVAAHVFEAEEVQAIAPYSLVSEQMFQCPQILLIFSQSLIY
jgi:hypothetical protein